MRRRSAASGLPERLRAWNGPDWRDDYTAPIHDRLSAWEAWFNPFAAWLDERHAYIEQHFPDKAWEYMQQEPRIPAMPFHESMI